MSNATGGLKSKVLLKMDDRVYHWGENDDNDTNLHLISTGQCV